jgi:hypothetical protein
MIKGTTRKAPVSLMLASTARAADLVPAELRDSVVDMGSAAASGQEAYNDALHRNSAQLMTYMEIIRGERRNWPTIFCADRDGFFPYIDVKQSMYVGATAEEINRVLGMHFNSLRLPIAEGLEFSSSVVGPAPATVSIGLPNPGTELKIGMVGYRLEGNSFTAGSPFFTGTIEGTPENFGPAAAVQTLSSFALKSSAMQGVFVLEAVQLLSYITANLAIVPTMAWLRKDLEGAGEGKVVSVNLQKLGANVTATLFLPGTQHPLANATAAAFSAIADVSNLESALSLLRRYPWLIAVAAGQASTIGEVL